MNKPAQAAKAETKSEKAPRDDGASPDALVDALYESLSFEPGSQPDWQRLRSLFLPQARIVPPQERMSAPVEAIDLETYIARLRPGVEAPAIAASGVQEIDAARNVVEFGNLAHVLSSTETIVGPEDAEPVARGINSLQLARSLGRWWIVSFLWDTERPDNPLPPGYLP